MRKRLRKKIFKKRSLVCPPWQMENYLREVNEGLLNIIDGYRGYAEELGLMPRITYGLKSITEEFDQSSQRA